MFLNQDIMFPRRATSLVALTYRSVAAPSSLFSISDARVSYWTTSPTATTVNQSLSKSQSVLIFLGLDMIQKLLTIWRASRGSLHITAIARNKIKPDISKITTCVQPSCGNCFWGNTIPTLLSKLRSIRSGLHTFFVYLIVTFIGLT